MTPRSIRRAAERKANKRARKAAQQQSAPFANPAPADDASQIPAFEYLAADYAFLTEPLTLTDETPAEPQTRQPRRAPMAPAIPSAAAANAYLAAIPATATSPAALLAAADVGPYNQLLRDYQNEFQPVGLQESTLVQSLAGTAWRARQAFALEMALFAKGRVEFAEQFAEHDPEIRLPLVDVHIYLTYEKQIRGLQLHEARLTRRAEKETAELRRLQNERKERDKAENLQRERAQSKAEEEHRAQLEAAAELYLAAQRNRQIFDLAQNGFKFSIHEIESYLAQKQAVKNPFNSTQGGQPHSKAA